MNTVSVIIPSYNRAAHLERALRSVLGQTSPADEIIVVDDGSTDNTHELVAGIGQSIQYCYQVNKGVSAARNRGIQQASSQWLAFLDSDDEWLPDKLAKQQAFTRQHTSSQIIHTDEIWIRNGIRVNSMDKHRKFGGDIFMQCLPLCAISPSSVMIKKTVFDEVGLFDETLPACEDYDMWLRICQRYQVDYLDEPLIVKYGGHDDQLSRRYWGMDRFRIRALEKIFHSATLNDVRRQAVAETICNKAGVYLKGAMKRNKTSEIMHYQALLKHYRNS